LVTAAADSTGGSVYHTSLVVKETGGKSGATITALSYTVLAAAGALSVARSPATARIPVGAALDLGPFDISDQAAAAAPQVTVSVAFVDDGGHAGSVTATATVSRPAPVPVPLFAVSGRVTDGTSGGVLPNILVQIVDGLNAGWSVFTDTGGNYTLTGVAAGTFTLSASQVSYQTTTVSVAVHADTRVDIVLPRTHPMPVGFAGTWEGTGVDSQGPMFVTWALTQDGSSVSGTVSTRAVHPDDGTCSSCHRSKSGTLSGTISGTTLTLSMFFAAGGSGDPTPICSASFSGSASSFAEGTLVASYSGSDTCEGLFSGGMLPMARLP
jgi:hypothetical protein